MQTLTNSATWPATVLTVIGMRSAPPPSAVAPPHPAEAAGRAKFTIGSMWMCGWCPVTRAPTNNEVATMKAISAPALRCTRLVPLQRQARRGHPHAQSEDDHGQGKQGPAPARRGAHGEPQGGAMVRHHHLVGVPCRARSLHMRHAGGTGEPDPPARLVSPPTEIHVLGVHEIRLVKTSQFFEGGAARQEAGARDPVGLDRARLFGGAGVVTLGEAVLRIEECKQRMTGGIKEGGKVTYGWIDRALRREDAWTDQSPGRVRLEDRPQRVDRSRMDVQI